MLTKPDLKDEKIVTCLHDNYGLDVAEISFLPLGADFNTVVYRVTTTDKIDYFLKLRSGDFCEPSVLVPHHLKQIGLQNIIPPIATKTDECWTNIDAFKVALYPYIDGRNAVDMKLSDTLDELITWAKTQPIDLKPKADEAFGFGYHDPREVPAEDFRFDLALSVPQNFKLNDQVIERKLPAGRYAVTTHKGSRDNIGDTIYGLYRDWLPESGEELGDLPCIFCYQNFDHEVAETELMTEIWVLLK